MGSRTERVKKSQELKKKKPETTTNIKDKTTLINIPKYYFNTHRRKSRKPAWVLVGFTCEEWRGIDSEEKADDFRSENLFWFL